MTKRPTGSDLSDGPEVRRTENPRGLLCGKALAQTRATSQRQLPTDHEHVVSTHGYQTDHRRCFFRPITQLRKGER